VYVSEKQQGMQKIKAFFVGEHAGVECAAQRVGKSWRKKKKCSNQKTPPQRHCLRLVSEVTRV
jgi:hypothetical protein